MSERVIQPHKEGMKRSMKDRITSVAQRNKSTSSPSSIPEQRTPQIQEKRRPIEQILVGTWNAVKPETQGKAIMKVYDKWFTPKYQTEEERKKAVAIRPKIEKIVGWTALGTEAALITFGAVKGVQKLRSIDWNAKRAKKIKPTRPIDDAVASAAVDVVPRHMKQAMGDVMGHLVGPKADWKKVLMPGSRVDLKKVTFSPGLQEQIMRGYFEKFFNRLQEPGVVQRINAVKAGRFEKEGEIRGVLMDVANQFVMGDVTRTSSFADLAFKDILNDQNVNEFRILLRAVRDWYRLAGCPGIERFGVQLK